MHMYLCSNTCYGQNVMASVLITGKSENYEVIEKLSFLEYFIVYTL